ncbi:nucleotide-binding universal stress UspA family protein [Devosia sp. UYZn731]|uniref:universal stress protein n=1 Tax=Devosia sp. UYZn731 TaxID=3156345 RepID=UPI00339829B7
MLTDVFAPLLTYPDAEDEGFVDEVVRFAGQFATSVAFCAFEIDIPEIVYSFGAEVFDVSALIADAEKLSHANAGRLMKHIAAIGGALPVTSSKTRIRQDQVTRAVTTMAQLRDLSMVQLVPNAVGQRQIAEGLIFGSGRPVVALPKTQERTWTIDSVAVAWDGSRAAIRAVHDAMGILTLAKSVTILTAFGDKAIGDGAVAGLAGYLSRHGIKARHHDIRSSGVPIGTALQNGAIDHGVGLLVMGAFGHSRIREFVLGGATRSILDDLRLPIFVSH